jgi:hypothetical protein
VNWLFKIFGLNSVDDLLRSSLTLLAYFALVGFALWQFGKVRGQKFFLGFAAGALYLLWVNSRNNTGTGPGGADKTTTLQDAASVSSGVIGLTADKAQAWIDSMSNP